MHNHDVFDDDHFAEYDDSGDVNQTVERMVADLHRYASGMLSRFRGNMTIQPTELVNMAFLKLHGHEHLADGEDSRPVFGLYVTTMKNLLRDHLRKRKRLKHGGGKARVEVGVIAELESKNQDPAALLDLLDELETIGKEREMQIVVLRIFYRLSNEEIASQLEVSVSTVEEDMRKAKAWLKDRLNPS